MTKCANRVEHFHDETGTFLLTKNTEVVIINQSQETRFEEELAKDVLEIITVFSARLCGSRSKKNQRLIDGMRNTVVEAENR